MTDWFHEIEGVISDIQAGQVNEVDVRTLQRVQGEMERMQQCIKRATGYLAEAMNHFLSPDFKDRDHGWIVADELRAASEALASDFEANRK